MSSDERTVYQSIAERAPQLSKAERDLLDARRRALLVELHALNRALGIATETRKERKHTLTDRVY
jgi:hypothetical protein